MLGSFGSFENQQRELNTLRNQNEIHLISAEHEVFIIAVAIISKELIAGNNGEQELVVRTFLEDFPDKPKDSWLPLDWAVAVSDRVEVEDAETIYTADSMALDKHHLEGNEEDSGYSSAHLFFIQKDPSLPLIRLLL